MNEDHAVLVHLLILITEVCFASVLMSSKSEKSHTLTFLKAQYPEHI